MGNCLKIQSSSSWSTDDDDDGDDGCENELGNGRKTVSGQTMHCRSPAGRRLEKMDEEGDGGWDGESQRAMHGEVKIRMTKKQLEELVSVVGTEGLSIAEFLERITSLGIAESQEHRRHWQPVLQSIPEEA